MSYDIAAFVKERDEALLSGDVERIKSFYVKHNPGMRTPPTEVIEVAMHKARTAALSLSEEAREASRVWLVERGYSHWSDKP